MVVEGEAVSHALLDRREMVEDVGPVDATLALELLPTAGPEESIKHLLTVEVERPISRQSRTEAEEPEAPRHLDPSILCEESLPDPIPAEVLSEVVMQLGQLTVQ